MGCVSPCDLSHWGIAQRPQGPKKHWQPISFIAVEIPDGISGPIVLASWSSGCVYLAVPAQLPGLELTRRRHQRTKWHGGFSLAHPHADLGSVRTTALRLGTLVSLGQGGGWTYLGDDVLNLMDIIECLSRILECEKETSLAQLSEKGRKYTLGSRQPFLCLRDLCPFRTGLLPRDVGLSGQQGGLKKTHPSPQEALWDQQQHDDHS